MFQKIDNLTSCVSRLRSSLLNGTLASLGIAALLHASQANAQTCGNALAATPVIFPISGSRVIVGQTVTITRVGLNSGDPGNCLFRNGEGYLLVPDGTVTRVVTNLNLNPSGSVPPPSSFLNCFGTNSTAAEGTCFAFNQTYVVQAADVGRSNAIVLPARGQLIAPQTIPYPGVAGQVVFGAAADADGFNPSSPGSTTGFASGSGSQFLLVVTPGLTITKLCDTNCFQFGSPISFHGTICNTGDVSLANITVVDSPAAVITYAATSSTGRAFDPANGLTNGECINYFGVYTPTSNLCGPFPDTIVVSGVASGVFNNPVFFATNSAVCNVCSNPGISVTKTCPPGLIQPGGLLTFTGVVTNTGNVPLTNVIIFNNQPAPNTVVFGPVTLAVHQSTNFSGSYTVPLDSCGPYTDTLTARGNAFCGGSVTNTDTKNCPSTNSPGIVVTKACPANPVAPGGTMLISGTVSNTGNITLTNVTVTNVIAAIGQSHLVFGPASLAPGQSVAFTDSYTVPLNSCGPYRDTVNARGADKCFGRIVTASDFKDCPVITTPRIALVKHCPVNPVAPGGVAVFSGTVSNAGNITLTNVIVVNNRPTNNTPVIGPITLLPGQSTNFTGSEVVPLNCCTYFDTLLATGNSICTGSNVVASATATCPTITTPRLSLLKFCPPNPVPLGQSLVYSGIVSNSGNIALINVTVVDNKPTNNTPVLGPISLAPGEFAPFTGSYPVPINICDTNMADTAFAQGNDVCTGSNVTASATAICPIVETPRLSLTKHCPPNPVAPGELLVFTGIVSNSGTITITNVFVVDDRPVPNTPVLGPVTLVPGQAVGFTGSYIAPYDCCGPCVDTVTARGSEICAGSNVIATASAACPRITTPRISVTRDCPPSPATVGGLLFFSGAVSNSGNATLNNVTVVDDQAGVVMDNIALAPGESVPFLGMYIATNCGPNTASGVAVTASDVCTGIVVSNRFVASCSIICTTPGPLVLYGEALSGGHFVFSFDTESNQTYTVQFTDALLPSNWQTITNVLGTGGAVTIPDSGTNAQRFYRVMIQQ